MTELWRTPATTLAKLIREREVSPVDVVDAILRRIDDVNPGLNAFCLVTAEQAIDSAREAEAAVLRGDRLGPLHGVPYSLKDLTPTAGVRTTLGSLLHRDDVPTEDAVVAERLRAAGGILVGKTNTPEYGAKAVTENRVFGTTRNPWDPARTPGGSSGGAAAAVAAGMAPLAEGSDYAGSVRIPAAHCGLVGIKPTDGLVPTYPEPLPFHPVSFLHGPLARTVDDAALMLEVMAGPDPRDPRSLRSWGGASEVSTEDASKSRLSYVGDHPSFAPVDAEVERLCREAFALLVDAGATVVDTPGDLRAIGDAEWTVSLLNANRRAALLAEHLPERAGELDPHLLRRIESLDGLTAVDAAIAERVQGDVYHEVRRLLESADVLVLPAVPTTAFEIGVNSPGSIEGTPITPLGLVKLTYVFNLSGHPALSVPVGYASNGMPVGLQLVARYHDEARLIGLARLLESARPWADRWPGGA